VLTIVAIDRRSQKPRICISAEGRHANARLRRQSIVCPRLRTDEGTHPWHPDGAYDLAMADAPDVWSRDGRSLGEWLPLLVHASPRTRRLAENAVSAMGWGVDVADAEALSKVPADRAAHGRAFATAISEAMLASDDGGAMLLERIVATIRVDRAERWRKNELEERLMDVTVDPASSEPGEADALQAEILAMSAADAGRLPNSHGPYTLNLVLQSAGEALRRHADLARAWFDDDDVAGDVLRAIASLGPRGGTFAPDLVARLEASARDRKHAHLEAIREALASVATRDGETVRHLVADARPTAENDPAAWAALETLARIGPAALAFAPTLVDDLLPPGDADENSAAYRLKRLAEIDPTRRDVFERLLAFARPSPPRLRTEQFDGRPYEVDEIPHRRGAAIDGLGHFVCFAGDAVPVLVDALSTFEEYDPDWGYELGEHGRVCDAIARLGLGAAGAVPALVDRLRTRVGSVDWQIVRTLGHLGPAATGALPALHAIAESEPDEVAPGEEPNERTEPLAWALSRIAGASSETK
jgi:hypothetical protein